MNFFKEIAGISQLNN